MDPAIIGAIAVLVLCLVGGAVVGSTQRKKEHAEFIDTVQRLFPGARVSELPTFRGFFGAELSLHGGVFLLQGSYDQEEGGDGFMHIYRTRALPENELARVPLGSHKFHWPVMTVGVKVLSEKISQEKAAEPGATDNPGDAQ